MNANKLDTHNDGKYENEDKEDNDLIFDDVYIWSIKCHKMSHLNAGIRFIDNIYHIINCKILDKDDLDITDSIKCGYFYVYDQQEIMYNETRDNKDIYYYCIEWNIGDIINGTYLRK